MPCEGWLKHSDLIWLEPTAEDSMFTLPVPSRTRKGKRTCLQKDSTPLSSTLPGSQNAFFSFFFTWAGESSRSILESSSEELILLPVSPGTEKQASPMLLKLAVNHFHRSRKCFFDSTGTGMIPMRSFDSTDTGMIPTPRKWFPLLPSLPPVVSTYYAVLASHHFHRSRESSFNSTGTGMKAAPGKLFPLLLREAQWLPLLLSLLPTISTYYAVLASHQFHRSRKHSFNSTGTGISTLRKWFPS